MLIQQGFQESDLMSAFASSFVVTTI
jgi:hypothetical protein